MPAIFDATDFLHPLDVSARQQLEAVPLLQAAVKKYLSAVTDRRMRQALLCSALRLGPRQLPEIYRLLPPICDAFGIDEPELYLMRGEANAETVGYAPAAIVIHNQLLEDLAEDEVAAVLAHECGHILAAHVLYRQMAVAMVRLGSQAGAMGSAPVKIVAGLASAQIQTALLDWYRKSELTADRAAVAYMGGPEPVQRALFHLVGVPKWMPGVISYAAFLEQLQEFDLIAESSRWDRYLSKNLESGSTHPIPVARIRELTTWAESETFRQLMDIAKIERLGERVNCAECGQSITAGWRFCERCGTAVPQPIPRADVAETGAER